MTILLAVLSGVLLMATLAAAGLAFWYRMLWRALLDAMDAQTELIAAEIAANADRQAMHDAVRASSPIAWINPASGVRH